MVLRDLESKAQHHDVKVRPNPKMNWKIEKLWKQTEKYGREMLKDEA